ncbi:MAG: ArnT family glycosyltransferase [Anaerolineales bacterium]
MGGIVAVFVNGYLLDDGFALQSRAAIAVTVLAAGLGFGAAWFLYPWVEKQWQSLPPAQRWKLLGNSLLLGSLLFFGGTSRWLYGGSRYLRFLLPVHHLQLSVSTNSPGSLKVVWFTTTLGDISFDAMEGRGWQRKEDGLVLTAPSENSLEWRGKVGKWVKIVFESKERARAILNWNGYSETIELPRGRYVYSQSFPVPLVANGVLVPGWIPLIIFTGIALLWVWPYRRRWAEESLEWLRSNPPFARWEWGFLLGVILFALLLRLWNLEGPPSVDELRHLLAARQVLEGNDFPQYQRSFWTVTLPVAFAFRIFGFHVWTARIPGIVFNAMGLLPFYLLARRINRPVALVASLLYATNPSLLVFSRMIREYAYYPFYFSWTAYGMLIFFEKIPFRFSIWRDGKYLLSSKTALMALSLLLPFGYALYDNSSTFKLILLSYLVLGILLLAKLDYKDKRNLILVTVLALAGLIVATWLMPRMLSDFKFSVNSNNSKFLTYFFVNPSQQWYFQRSAIFAALAFSASLYFVVFLQRKKEAPLTFILLNFLFYMAFFLLADNPLRPMRLRHASVTAIWFTILIAAGGWLIWRFLCLAFRARTLPYILMAALLPFSFNATHIFTITVSQNGLTRIGEDFVPDNSRLHKFMIAHVNSGDALIATAPYRSYVFWMRQPNFSAIYSLALTTPLTEVTSIIQTHPSGWIVIDRTRINQLTFDPFQAFASLGLEYTGTFGENQDEYLWRWQREK